MDVTSAAFWAALGSIVLTNIVLSGDNAVVIALAARALPATQQSRAIFWGGASAIVLRIALTLAAVRLLQLPFLKIIGGVLLLYVGTRLLAEEGDDAHPTEPAGRGLWIAVRTILVADVVMSLDNVLAVAAAAKGSLLLLTVGLAISVPLIVFGSSLLMKVMERLPILVTLGGALLGFLAGDMLLSDPVIAGWFGPVSTLAQRLAGGAGAVFVVALGFFLRRRRHAH